MILEGIRVLDFSQYLAGAGVTRLMAELGAEIIKVETKTGDLIRHMNGKSVTPGMGAKFLHLNRNKRSVALDLRTPEGQEARKYLMKFRKADGTFRRWGHLRSFFGGVYRCTCGCGSRGEHFPFQGDPDS